MGCMDRLHTCVAWGLMCLTWPSYILLYSLPWGCEPLCWGAAFTQGWDMTLVLLAVTPLLAVVGAAVASVMGGMSTKANTAYAHANGIVQESLSNIRTVAAFNGQEQTVRR